MSRLSLINFVIGFTVILIASSAGAFIGLEMTQNEIAKIPESWGLVLRRSAHGHFNLFGLIHILFGLTLPYSNVSTIIKKWQSIGLFLGTLSMGPGMIYRSTLPPTDDFDLATWIVSLGLSCYLLAMTIHILGLLLKIRRSVGS